MEKTVWIETYADAILIMRWESHITIVDMEDVFLQILGFLDEATQPVYVIVDIRKEPNFPLVETMVNAATPAQHTRLAEWIMLGSTDVARHIASFLYQVSGRDNYQWFQTEDEALEYIEKRQRINSQKKL